MMFEGQRETALQGLVTGQITCSQQCGPNVAQRMRFHCRVREFARQGERSPAELESLYVPTSMHGQERARAVRHCQMRARRQSLERGDRADYAFVRPGFVTECPVLLR